jgi:MFS transporter, DHA1 family, tetracycline resistance protein
MPIMTGMSANAVSPAQRIAPGHPASTRDVQLTLAFALLDGIGVNAVIPLLPFLALQFGASPVLVGALAAAYSAAALLGAPVFGRLTDRLGSKLAMVAGAGMASVVLFAMAWAPSFWPLLCLRAHMGFASAKSVAVQARLAAASSDKGRARLFGVLGAVTGVAAILGPALGGVVSNLGGGGAWSSPFVMAAGCCGLAALAGLALGPGVLSTIPGDLRAASTCRHDGTAPLSRGALTPILAMVFCGGFGIYVIMSMSALYAHARFGWQQAEAGLLLSYSALVYLPVQLVLVRVLSARFRIELLFTAALALMGFGLGTVALARGTFGLYAAYTVFSTGMALFLTFSRSHIAKFALPEHLGRVMSLYQMAAASGQLMAPIVSGLLFERFSAEAPFAAACAIVTLGAALGGVALRRHEALAP